MFIIIQRIYYSIFNSIQNRVLNTFDKNDLDIT